MGYAGGLEKPATPEPKRTPKLAGDSSAPWALAGASPGTPASLRLIQDQEAAAGNQVERQMPLAEAHFLNLMGSISFQRCMSPVFDATGISIAELVVC